MFSEKSSVSFVVTMVGSIGIMTLYTVTRTDMAEIFGMDAGGIGHLGIISKVLQVGAVIGSFLVLLQTKKDKRLNHKESNFVN